MTPRSGNAAFTARMARLQRFSGRQASSPVSDLSSGGTTGNRAIAGTPSSAASPAASTRASIDRRNTPGMAATGSRALAPSWTKTGQMRSSAASRFSATRRRTQPKARLRRSLTLGYSPMLSRRALGRVVMPSLWSWFLWSRGMAGANLAWASSAGKAQGIDGRQMSRRHLPARTLIAGEPEMAAGGPDGEPLTGPVDGEAVAQHQVVGMTLRQALALDLEAAAAIGRPGDDDRAVHWDAALVLDRGHEPGALRVFGMDGDAETEFGRLDRRHLLPALAGVGRVEDAVVMLGPECRGPRRTLHQAMDILDRGVIAAFGRHEFRVDAFGGRPPAGASILALPDAAAGHRQGQVLRIFGVDADRVDSRRLVPAAEPVAAKRMIPEAIDELPTLGPIGRVEQSAADRPGPEFAWLLARLKRPDFQNAGPILSFRRRKGGAGDFLPCRALVLGGMQLDAEMTELERGIKPAVPGIRHGKRDGIAKKGRAGDLPALALARQNEQALPRRCHQPPGHDRSTSRECLHDIDLVAGCNRSSQIHLAAVQVDGDVPAKARLIVQDVAFQARLLDEDLRQDFANRPAGSIEAGAGQMPPEVGREADAHHGPIINRPVRRDNPGCCRIRARIVRRPRPHPGIPRRITGQSASASCTDLEAWLVVDAKGHGPRYEAFRGRVVMQAPRDFRVRTRRELYVRTQGDGLELTGAIRLFDHHAGSFVAVFLNDDFRLCAEVQVPELMAGR